MTHADLAATQLLRHPSALLCMTKDQGMPPQVLLRAVEHGTASRAADGGRFAADLAFVLHCVRDASPPAGYVADMPTLAAAQPVDMVSRQLHRSDLSNCPALSFVAVIQHPATG